MAERAVEAIKRVPTRHFVGLAVVISMTAWPDASLADDAAGQGLRVDHAAGRYEYTNGLIDSNDPYLLLHAHNPVDWYPWGPEAFAKAKKENKPIFISIGYSTCYWCHVAERTIYSNPDIAKLMNQWFVNVKVDSEQRPDVDRIYMLARLIMTGAAVGRTIFFSRLISSPFTRGAISRRKMIPEAARDFRPFWLLSMMGGRPIELRY